MLKILFWTLLAANLALFAYDRGYLEAVFPSGREPARMSNQINADRIRLMPPAAAPAVPASNPPAPAASPAAGASAAAALTKVAAAAQPAGPAPDNAGAALACAEIGNFSAEDAKRFSAELAPLALGERLSQHPVQKTSYIVFIPSQGDKDGADRKAGELRRRGITDFFIIQDDSPLRWGISLGVFRSEEAARQHLADLTQQGVRTARIGQRNTNAGMVAFRIKDVSVETRAAVEKAKAAFPKQEIKRCESA